MRLERIAPRTWLLAAVAAWAVACWLLAIAGLGAHARVLPVDPALVQALPQVPPGAQPRLGPLAQYESIIARPLFASDRRPHPFELEATGDDEGAPAGTSFDYMLTSVLIAPSLHMAIVQPQGGGDSIRVRLGGSADAFPGWTLVALAPRSAVFEGPGGRQALELRTYDGSGGEAPSQIPAAAARQRAIDAAAAEQSEQASAAAAAAAQAGPARAPAENQMEAIRKRIEARRAQLRQEAAQSTAPARKP